MAMTSIKLILPPYSGDVISNLKLSGDGSIGSWGTQRPGRTTPEFMAALMGAVLLSLTDSGSFNMKQLDHRAGFDYLGVSNKELTIHASELAGRPVRNYKIAKLIVLHTLMQHVSVSGDIAIDPTLLSELSGGPDVEPETASSETDDSQTEVDSKKAKANLSED